MAIPKQATLRKGREDALPQREQAHSAAQPERDIVVIGTSAGGPSALRKLVSGLSPDFPGAVFVTMHVFSRTETALVSILNQAGGLPAFHPPDEAPITGGRIYIAPPDRHLILRRGSVELGRGPRENLQRPSINAMFRSAAEAYASRVIGIVLTGLMDDGAAGLWEIKRCGGLTVIQDPLEAHYPSMPRAAQLGVDVHLTLKLAEIPSLVNELVKPMEQSMEPKYTPPGVVEDLANQSCPECGGAMMKKQLGALLEYRCHTGHRFGQHSMLEAKLETQKRYFWSAYAQAEEIAELFKQPSEPPNSAVDEEVQRQQRIRAAMREILELDSAS